MYAEVVDTLILALLIAWATLDRFNIYFREKYASFEYDWLTRGQ